VVSVKIPITKGFCLETRASGIAFPSIANAPPHMVELLCGVRYGQRGDAIWAKVGDVDVGGGAGVYFPISARVLTHLERIW